MRLELINRRRGRLQGHIRPGLFAGVYSPVERLHGLELIVGTFTGSLGYLQLDKGKAPGLIEGGCY